MAELASSLPSKIEDSLEQPPICMIAKQVPLRNIEAFLAIELNKLHDLVNIDDRLNIQGNQISFIASSLLDMFPNENLADFVICFKQGALGQFGDIYRVDGAVICGWMEQYLDKKYQIVETKLKEERKDFEETNPTEADLKLYNERMAKVMESIGYIPKVDDNAKNNEYERFKLTRTWQQPADVIKAKELHIQWIKENFNPITGKKLPEWVEEADWLKLREIGGG